MTCKEFYIKEMGVDISLLPLKMRNIIATNYLEYIIFPKEELREFFKENGVDFPDLEKGEKEQIVGGKADNKSFEDIAKKHNVELKDIEDQYEMGLSIEKEHTDNKEEAGEIVKDHLWEFYDYYTRLKEMEEEPLEDFIEKGKVAQVGEIREWGGVRMQKTNEGWIPVKENKSSKQEEITDKKKTEYSSIDSKKEYSGEELKNFARQTSTEDLKIASEGADEKLRIAAKEELRRRESQESIEVPQKEQLIEKFRTFSDDLIRHYYNAPYEGVKDAARFIADERGLILEEEFEPLELDHHYEKVEKFFDGFKKDLPKINSTTYKVLEKYKHNSTYINDPLRKGLESDPDTVEIDKVFRNNTFKLDSDIVTFRGVRDYKGIFIENKEMDSGFVFKDLGFVSTSVQSEVAKSFMPYVSRNETSVEIGAFFEIRIRKGTSVIPIHIVGQDNPDLKQTNQEAEILLNRNSMFKIIGKNKEVIEDRGTVTKIIVELM